MPLAQITAGGAHLRQQLRDESLAPEPRLDRHHQQHVEVGQRGRVPGRGELPGVAVGRGLRVGPVRPVTGRHRMDPGLVQRQAGERGPRLGLVPVRVPGR